MTARLEFCRFVVIRVLPDVRFFEIGLEEAEVNSMLSDQRMSDQRMSDQRMSDQRVLEQDAARKDQLPTKGPSRGGQPEVG